MGELKNSVQKTWRYEYKFVVYNFSLEELKLLVLGHPKSFIERYPVRSVNNIYFDTNDFSSYHDSLSGCSRRTKLRFRWYGDSMSEVKGFLELKERMGPVLSKTTQKIEDKINLHEFDWAKFESTLNERLHGRLRIEFLQSCVPVLINNYRRCYYETFCGKYRITLDSNLKIFDQRFYNRPNLSFQEQAQNCVILEIKAQVKDGVNLNEFTNFFPFRLTQNSKYVSGVTGLI